MKKCSFIISSSILVISMLFAIPAASGNSINKNDASLFNETGMTSSQIDSWVNDPKQNIYGHSREDVIAYLRANYNPSYSFMSESKSSTWSNRWFSSGKWINRSGLVSLSLMPTDWVTVPHAAHATGPKAWETVKSRFGNDKEWRKYPWADESMLGQFKCHVGYGKLKVPYNLEPSREHFNPITCN